MEAEVSLHEHDDRFESTPNPQSANSVVLPVSYRYCAVGEAGSYGKVVPARLFANSGNTMEAD